MGKRKATSHGKAATGHNDIPMSFTNHPLLGLLGVLASITLPARTLAYVELFSGARANSIGLSSLGYKGNNNNKKQQHNNINNNKNHNNEACPSTCCTAQRMTS